MSVPPLGPSGTETSFAGSGVVGDPSQHGVASQMGCGCCGCLTSLVPAVALTILGVLFLILH